MLYLHPEYRVETSPYDIVLPVLRQMGVGELVLVEYEPPARRRDGDPSVISDNLQPETVKMDEVEAFLGGSESDVGLSSRVPFDVDYHLFFLDLATNSTKQACAYLDRVNAQIARRDMRTPRWALFSSGRSFHAYDVGFLYSPTGWSMAMGCALSACSGTNASDRFAPTDVDTHWIANVLAQGYGILRWTKVSNRYKKLPEFLGYLETTPYVPSTDDDIEF
jgi:hypothetical protein